MSGHHTDSSATTSQTQTFMRPAEAAQTLGIPASTLRRWSRRFAAFLSPEANGVGRGDHARSHRRYTPDDMVVLARCKALLSEGLTLDQVAQRLEVDFSSHAVTVAVEIDDEPAREQEAAEVSAGVLEKAPVRDDAGLSAGHMLAQTLTALSDSQQMILTGQENERALLGVVIQDNFNLKEANKRLRERVVETERNLFELKREMEKYREDERERMRQMEAYLFQLQRQVDVLTRPPVMPPAPAQPASPRQAITSDDPAPQPEVMIPAETPASRRRRGIWAWLLGE